MILTGYRHVIWDWNGTLLDDLDLCVELINGILGRNGLPTVDRAGYHAEFNFPVRDYYRRIGLEVEGQGFERLSAEFIGGYEQRRLECGLHDGALEALAAVEAAGLTQSILSAYRQETLQEIVAHFGLTARFIRLNGLSDIYAHGKIELGRRWLRELGLPPADVLLIGDTLHDAEVARELGVDCALVAGGHHPESRLRGASRYYFPSCAALCAAFRVHT